MSADDPLLRYQVMDPLGRGGSGRTFRGVDRATQQQVAIKVVSLRSMDDGWKQFDLFEREIAVLKSLEHPGIPRYLDSYASEGTGDYFLVMELVEGTPLGQRLAEQRRLEPAALKDLLEQGLKLLGYLHGLSPPVIHRDIKPANLILDPRGKLWLVDFGGVRQAAQAEGNTTVGTFGYMAPEQLHGEATSAADLYSLGATIAALHAGCEADKLPHDGLHMDLEALDLPAALAPVLEPMLEPNPKRRARDAKALLRRLREPSRPPSRGPAASSSTASTSSSAPPRPDPPPTALVPVEGLRDLARVPRPLSVLVWLISGMGAGAITVFQVLLVPLIFRLARHLSRNEARERKARLEDGLQRFETTVGQARRSLSFVAGETHPFRDAEAGSSSESRSDPRRRR